MNMLEAVELAMVARRDGYTVDSIGLSDAAADTWSIRIRLVGEMSRDIPSQEGYTVFTEAMVCPHTTILVTTCTDDPRQAVAMCRDCGAEYGTGDPDNMQAQQERYQLHGMLVSIRTGMRDRQLPNSLR